VGAGTLGTGVDRTAAGCPVGAHHVAPDAHQDTSGPLLRDVAPRVRTRVSNSSDRLLWPWRPPPVPVGPAAARSMDRPAHGWCWRLAGRRLAGQSGAMTIVRIRGLKRFRHRKSGIWYSYHRKSGVRIEPPHRCGTPEFFAALNEAETKHKAKAPVPGTFGALVRSYRNSSVFLTLKARSRRDYLHVSIGFGTGPRIGFQSGPLWAVITPAELVRVARPG
jgi:hypothetical protein